MKLSIVTTAYKSTEFLREFHLRMSNAVKKITDDYEIIFVNDGCPDESLSVLREIINQDEKSKLINLSRNFGHHKAMMTGMEHAQGDYIFTIDCDLEEQPEELEKFYQKIIQGGDDCINSVIKARKGGLIEKKFDGLFYPVFNFLSNQKIAKNLCTASLMSKRYVESLVKYREQGVYLAGIKALNGFKQSYIFIKKTSRKSERSYNFLRRVSLAVNSITSFSSKPLYYIFYLGIIISSCSTVFGFCLIYKKFFQSVSIEGWSSIMVSLWFIAGVITMSLGVIAIYLAKIFTEIKPRPYAIIEGIYQKHDHKTQK